MPGRTRVRAAVSRRPCAPRQFAASTRGQRDFKRRWRSWQRTGEHCRQHKEQEKLEAEIGLPRRLVALVTEEVEKRDVGKQGRLEEGAGQVSGLVCECNGVGANLIDRQHGVDHEWLSISTRSVWLLR